MSLVMSQRPPFGGSCVTPTSRDLCASVALRCGVETVFYVVAQARSRG